MYNMEFCYEVAGEWEKDWWTQPMMFGKEKQNNIAGILEIKTLQCFSKWWAVKQIELKEIQRVKENKHLTN